MGKKTHSTFPSIPWKAILRWAFVLFALAALFWLLNKIGWNKIGHAFVAVGWSGALILVILGLSESTLDAAALDATMPRRIGLWRMLSYHCAGAIVNTLVPGEAGEVLKGSMLGRHVSTQQAIAGTVLWNYIFKLTRPLAALLAVLVSMILGADVESKVTIIVLAGSILSFAPYLVLKLLLRKGMAELIARILNRLRILKKDPEGFVKSAAELDHSIRTFWRDRPGAYLKVFGLQIAARTSTWITLFATARFMGLDYSFGLCALIYAGLSVGDYVVMTLPARIGVSEGAGYLIFSFFGLDGGTGVIIYVLLRLKGLIANLIPALAAAHNRERN